MSKIGVQILSYNKPELLMDTLCSLNIQPDSEDYKIVVWDQSDKSIQTALEVATKGPSIATWCFSPENIGQRGASNAIYSAGYFDDCDYILFSDHDNRFEEPLGMLTNILDKYPDCIIATGYMSPEHEPKGWFNDPILGNICQKNTARFGCMMLRREHYEALMPMDEQASCGGAAWFCGADWWLTDHAPLAPARTKKKFIYCLPGHTIHAGAKDSTWLDHFEHPEYTADELALMRCDPRYSR